MPRRTNKGKRPMVCTEARAWSDLPKELLDNILKRLDPTYLLWVICLVCRSWQVTALDILFRPPASNDRLLDLDKLGLLCHGLTVRNNVNAVGLAVIRVIRSLFDPNGDMFNDTIRAFEFIYFPLQISDEHLTYAAERTCKIKGVYLELSGDITDQGLSRALRNWRELEMISIIPARVLNYYPGVFQDIGINCGKLQELRIVLPNVRTNRNMFHLNELGSLNLAHNLSTLKSLKLVSCCIYKYGLVNIMEICPQVEVIRLEGCWKALNEVGRNIPFDERTVTAILVKLDGGWSINHRNLEGLPVRSVVDKLWERCY